jgi:hypothetical protein
MSYNFPKKQIKTSNNNWMVIITNLYLSSAFIFQKTQGKKLIGRTCVNWVPNCFLFLLAEKTKQFADCVILQVLLKKGRGDDEGYEFLI